MRPHLHRCEPSSRRRPPASTRPWGLALVVVAAVAVLAGCNDFVVDQPGVYTGASTQAVTGQVPTFADDPLIGVTVNGVDAALDGARFDATIPLDGAAVFNPVLVVARYASGKTSTRRSTVVYGDGTHATVVPLGDTTGSGMTTRLTPSALAKLGPEVTAALDLPPAALGLPTRTLGSPSVQVEQRVPVSIPRRTVSFDTPGYLRGTVVLPTVEYRLTIVDVAIGQTCALSVTLRNLTGVGRYDVGVDPADPSHLRVTTPGSSVLSDPGATTLGCANVSPYVLTAIVNDTHVQAENQLRNALGQYDGNPPVEAPVSRALEQTLAALSPVGAVGGGVDGIALATTPAAPFEDGNGIGAGYDATVAATPVDGAPTLSGSLALGDGTAGAPPDTTPDGRTYDLAFGVSVTAINQLLSAMTSRSGLTTSIGSVDGAPLTYDALTAVVPIGPPLAVDRPVVVEVHPELAPAMTTATPPEATVGVVHVGGLGIDVRFADADQTIVGLVIDLDASATMTVAADAVQLAITPDAIDLAHVDRTANPSNLSDVTVRALLGVFGDALLGSLTTPLTLPSPFAGHALQPVASGRIDGTCYVFARLG